MPMNTPVNKRAFAAAGRRIETVDDGLVRDQRRLDAQIESDGAQRNERQLRRERQQRKQKHQGEGGQGPVPRRCGSRRQGRADRPDFPPTGRQRPRRPARPNAPAAAPPIW